MDEEPGNRGGDAAAPCRWRRRCLLLCLSVLTVTPWLACPQPAVPPPPPVHLDVPLLYQGGVPYGVIEGIRTISVKSLAAPEAEAESVTVAIRGATTQPVAVSSPSVNRVVRPAGSPPVQPLTGSFAASGITTVRWVGLPASPDGMVAGSLSDGQRPALAPRAPIRPLEPPADPSPAAVALAQADTGGRLVLQPLVPAALFVSATVSPGEVATAATGPGEQVALGTSALTALALPGDGSQGVVVAGSEAPQTLRAGPGSAPAEVILGSAPAAGEVLIQPLLVASPVVQGATAPLAILSLAGPGALPLRAPGAELPRELALVFGWVRQVDLAQDGVPQATALAALAAPALVDLSPGGRDLGVVANVMAPAALVASRGPESVQVASPVRTAGVDTVRLPDAVDATWLRLQELYARREYGEAVELAERVLAGKELPSAARVRWQIALAQCHVAQGDSESARQVLVSAQTGAEGETLLRIADGCRLLGLPDEAATVYQRLATDATPLSPAILLWLAEYHFGREQFDGAVAHYRQAAAALAPESRSGPLYRQGLCLERLQRPAEARQAYLAALQHAPDEALRAALRERLSALAGRQ